MLAMGKSANNTSADAGGKRQNDLPAGAKLDYRDEVDRMHSKAQKAIDEHMKKMEHLLEQNTELVAEIRDLLVAQRKSVASMGARIGDPNPVVKNLQGKFGGLNDFALLGREHEKKICANLGFTPEGGDWDVALLNLANAIKNDSGPFGGLTMPLSSGKPKEKSEQQNSAPKKAKKAVKRVRI
ncbi:MAG: hypothetical protein LBI56_02710 [Puniceicoccales bacterium]|jgi:hypothetical protein|nr:hypothetical protein [Puniceicoccales bacterium]